MMHPSRSSRNRIGKSVPHPTSATVDAVLRDLEERRSSLDQVMLAVSEAERKRLGQEFHDGLGQRLTSLALSAAMIAHKLEARSDPLAEEAQRLVRLVDETVREARGVIRGLYPAALLEDGLEGTVRAMLDRIRESSDLEADLIVENWTPDLSESEQLHLFRVVQESVNNAIKHGACRRIVVHFVEDIDGRSVIVEDDGHGIPREYVPGIGHRLMKHRADVLGGALEVNERVDGGTKVALRVPRTA